MTLKKQDLGSSDRFGYEWNKYNKIIPEYETQFLKWIYPLKKSDFKGKVVCDAGCGIGRNSYWAIMYGAKKVIAYDCDKKSLIVARKNIGHFKNAKSEWGSLYKPKYKNKFDISFAIGVIHHLKFPRKAVQTLVKATKQGGTVHIWVYGYKGIGSFVVKYINPIRKITSRLPITATHTISYFFSIPLYFYLKLFPHKNSYFKQLSGFSFWHISHIIFDQLLPRIANYWKKEEVLSLFENQGLEDIRIFKVNNMSWTIIGKKK